MHLSREFWKRRRGPASSSSPTSTNKTDTRRRTAGKSGHTDREGEEGKGHEKEKKTREGWRGRRRHKECPSQLDVCLRVETVEGWGWIKTNLGSFGPKVEVQDQIVQIKFHFMWNVSENTVIINQ